VEHFHEFDLNQDPFQNEPDLRFFCASPTHRRAKLRVDRALRQSKGLVVLAGEGGTGKSLLARSIFEELEEEVFESSLMVMMQGTADAVSVLRRFSAQLGMEDPPTDRAELLAVLYDQLAVVREDGRHAVLIIDDAHVLGQEAMAEIAGLLSFEYEDRRLISLLLVGLPELDEIVAAVPSLGDRVDVRVRLDALSEGEAAAYLAHRIEVAGGQPDIFEASAVKAIYTLGRGRPRRMNTLADNALFEAFLGGHKQVSEEDVHAASDDLPFVATSPGYATHRYASDAAPEPDAPGAMFETEPAFESPPVLADVPPPAPEPATFEAFEPFEATSSNGSPVSLEATEAVGSTGSPVAAFFADEPAAPEVSAESFSTDELSEPSSPFTGQDFGQDLASPEGSSSLDAFASDEAADAESSVDDPFGDTLDGIDDAELHLDVEVGFESTAPEADFTMPVASASAPAGALDQGEVAPAETAADPAAVSSVFDDVQPSLEEDGPGAFFGPQTGHRADAFEFGDEAPQAPATPSEPQSNDEFDDLFADLIDD